jgi:type VI secretion system protein ImpG
MDTRLLHHYNNELSFMREMGSEFARQFPKVAGRLGMEGLECADPYVERLLEGFAFLTARVQLKIEEEHPKFCQHLLEIVYPDYLAPLPSMTVVQLQPNCSDAELAKGLKIERGTSLESGLGPNMQTPCEYRTALSSCFRLQWLMPITWVPARPWQTWESNPVARSQPVCE